MAKISDIEDTTMRTGLEEADQAIGDGEYTKAARKCAEMYLNLLEKRPDLIPPPFDWNRAAPQNQSGLPNPQNRGAGGIGTRRMGWPGQGGIRVIFDEDRRPSISYEKDSFSLSEAATYFEFMIEEVMRAQREPAAK